MHARQMLSVKPHSFRGILLGWLVLSLPARELWRPPRASWPGDSSKSEATSCGVALGLPTLSLLEWDKVRG